MQIKRSLGCALLSASAIAALPPQLSASIAGPESGLAAHFTFDDGTGADASGNANDGILLGTPLAVPGIVGAAALCLDGTRDSLSASLATANTENFTLAAWIYWNGSSKEKGVATIVYNGSPGRDGYGLLLSDGNCSSGDKLVVQAGSVTCQATQPEVTVAPNTWTHVALARDADQWTLYTNGNVAASGSGFIPKTATGRTTVGAANSTDFFAGCIDDVRIYDRAASRSEIAELAALDAASADAVAPTLKAVANKLAKLRLAIDSSVASARSADAPKRALPLFEDYEVAISPLHANPGSRYLVEANDNPVLLTGSHHWKTLQDFTNLTTCDFDAYLDMCVSNNWNLIRMWHMDKPSINYFNPPWGSISPTPWTRTGPGYANDGGLKWDLGALNQAFFDRMSNRVKAANARGIYVSVMLFNGVAIRGHPEQWAINCHNPANNVDGVSITSNNIYSLDDPVWLHHMTNYVRKVVNTVNGFDGVMFEIGNEMPPWSKDFQYYMVNLIKDYERTQTGYKQHLVGMTSFDSQTVNVDHQDGNAWLLSGPADWISLFDGDINNPPLPPTQKINIYDSDHVQGMCATVDWVWKVFTRGHGGIWNMDPYDFPGLGWDMAENERVRKALGVVRRVAARVNLKTLLPSTSECSTTFILTNAAGQYVAFSPDANSYSINLPAGFYYTEHLDPVSGAVCSSNIFKLTASEGHVMNNCVGSAEANLTVKIPDPGINVVGRWIFYNNSYFDGTNSVANAMDDQAIAIDKAALCSNACCCFGSYTSYSR